MTQFIPVGNSESGLSLTTKNWQDAKVKTLSYSLENLLYKPGLEFLQTISDLPAYLGWSGDWTLNASSLVANREGIYSLKSPYDGSRLKLSASELVHLIVHLKPNRVLLPKKILQDCPSFQALWSDSMVALFHVSDYQAGMEALYFEEKERDLLAQHTGLKCYLMSQSSALDLEQVEWIESDRPSVAAFSGTVYSSQGEIDLAQTNAAMQFEIIEKSCACPTCSQQFTKAYLHHLLHHTPLLCQRFLMQHNWFYLSQRT